MLVKERLEHLFDPGYTFEIGKEWAHGMYEEFGGCPKAGVITQIGSISDRACMVIANDATVKAGALFPQSVKKILRSQKIAWNLQLPIIYLVDSSGVFLPLQEEIFPDEDDFGRIFYNNSIFAQEGLPQIAAIMGNCIAGGGYLPVLCDQLLMTEGSGLYIAGPALVEAAIGQKSSSEELGGAKMHAEVSGTIDYLEKDDASCLKKIRELISYLPNKCIPLPQIKEKPNVTDYQDVRTFLESLVEKGSLLEYKAEYGKTVVCAFGKINGQKVGLVANQKMRTTTGEGEMQIGGVIYVDSAEKTARFVHECSSFGCPLLFFQDVVGFMVGRDSEREGIIESGAKLVQAISTSKVSKITTILGNSFGAGHYALCGKAYNPDLIVAWPQAKYAVMGAEQAAQTLLKVGKKDPNIKEGIVNIYRSHMDIKYGAGRGWVDAIIEPSSTKNLLAHILPLTGRKS